MKSMFEKLKMNIGETLVETLVAMLIATLSMTILAGAIISTVRLKKTGEDVDSSLSNVNEAGVVTGVKTVGPGTVKIEDGHGNGGREITVTIKSSSKEDLFFYEKN